MRQINDAIARVKTAKKKDLQKNWTAGVRKTKESVNILDCYIIWS